MSMSKDEYIELRWRFVPGEPVLESTLNRMTAVGGETPVYKVRNTPSSHFGAVSAHLGRVFARHARIVNPRVKWVEVESRRSLLVLEMAKR